MYFYLLYYIHSSPFYSRLICIARNLLHIVAISYVESRDLSRDDWIKEFIKRKSSSGLFGAVGAEEKKKPPNCHKYATAAL